MSPTTNPIQPTTKSSIATLGECRALFLAAREDVRALVADLNDDDFNWRPSEGEWSVAECLDHLVSIGTLIMPVLDDGIEKARANGWTSDGPFRYGAIGNWFVRVTGPTGSPPKRKFKAPKMYAPTGRHSVSRLLDSFTALQDDFVTHIDKADGLDIARVKVPSPALKLLRLSLGQWFALLAGHQQRHFLQAQKVRAALESTKK